MDINNQYIYGTYIDIFIISLIQSLCPLESRLNNITNEVIMKLSISIVGSLMCCLSLFCTSQVEAGFTNSGRMQSNQLNLSVGGTLDNNGELIGIESANIKCDTLSGKGLIKLSQITIKAKLFAFTGVIECDGKCTITTGSTFNKKMFKRKGKGEFVFVIDENLGKALNPSMSIDSYIIGNENDDDYCLDDELQLLVE